MWGRDHGITLRDAAPGEVREGVGGSSRSVHSSDEASNDRGAKGCRKADGWERQVIPINTSWTAYTAAQYNSLE